MLKKRKVLPPLDYFLAFEATAKQGSIARASGALHISESSISRKLRLLEQHYDTQLFERGHRSIRLTLHGAALMGKVTQALDILRDGSDDIFARQQVSPVTLAATNSVAALWLMPRLREFDEAHPRAKIMLVASDDDAECLAETVDLAILRGEGHWPGFDAQLLFGETVFPVCAPGFLRANPQATDITRLAHLDLIEVASSHTEWMDWKTWLGQQDIQDAPLRQAAFFNTYPLAIQAAVDGLGVALGWGHLVDRLLAAGDLVRPVASAFARTQSGYYLLKRQGKTPFPEQTSVETWLLQESAARKRFAP